MSARVAYVVDSWIQSSQTFVRDEVAELRRQGAHVSLVALRHGDLVPGPGEEATCLSDLVTSAAGRAIALARRPNAAVWLARSQAAMRPERIHYRAALPAVADTLRDDRIEWVHTHFGWEASGVAEAVAALLGVGWSFTAHANDIFVANTHLGGKLARADRLVTVCRYNHDEMRTRYGELPPTEVVACGVDVPHDDAELSRPRPRHPRRRPPGSEEGFRRPRRAASAMQVALAAPVDRDRRRRTRGTRLAELIDDLDLTPRVRLLGSRPHDWVLGRMAQARLVCLPAWIARDGDRDSMPVVLKEAMARRVPVVTTTVAGIPELVDDSVGRVVPPDDPDALAAALDEVLADPALSARLGDAGRARVQSEFSLAAEVARLHRVLPDMVRVPSPPVTVAVLMAVGPGTREIERADDVIDSIVSHEPSIGPILLVDDTPTERELLEELSGPGRPVAVIPNPRRRTGPGLWGGLAAGILHGYGWLQTRGATSGGTQARHRRARDRYRSRPGSPRCWRTSGSG